MVSLGPQELINTVWAFAKVGHTDVPLMRAVAERLATMEGLTPREIANCAWAFATLAQRFPPLELYSLTRRTKAFEMGLVQKCICQMFCGLN